MLPKIRLQGSPCKGNCKCNCVKTEDALEMYREAAKSDAFLFGDYDGYKAFEDLDQEDSQGGPFFINILIKGNLELK